ncbi:MAG: ImmA/IrrE family metallo-endopeptidase [Balneolales bacterium]
MKTTLQVNNAVISWAISRAGFEPNDFFIEYPKARDWVEDIKEPTLPQLRDFARKVHLPFGYLLLEEPPAEKLPIPFFRTLPGDSGQISLNIRDTIFAFQKRQDWLRDYLKDQGYDPLLFVGKFSVHSPIKDITTDIKDTLGLPDRWAARFPNWQKALDYLGEKAEEAGIFISFNSVVGNNTHRPIEVEECRGFVLTDEYAPFMFINAADSKSAQMFTIVHELAHIWIGESAGFDFRHLHPAENDVETFCDRVAAELLVPKKSFYEEWAKYQNFDSLAKVFKVSQIVIARRALDLGTISRTDFFDFYHAHVQRHYQQKESTDGGNFFATLRKRLNLRFMTIVNRAVRENQLLYRDAYDLTGLRGTTYEKAINEFQL